MNKCKVCKKPTNNPKYCSMKCMGIDRKNMIPWNKDLTQDIDRRVCVKPFTNEHKKNISLSLTGRKLTQEHIDNVQKNRNSHKGRPGKKKTDAEKKVLSSISKKLWQNVEYRKKIRKSMSIAATKRWRNKTYIKMMSDNHKGSRNGNWHGGIAFEPYGIKFDKSIKKEVKKRDRHICRYCGLIDECTSQGLNVHHIDYNKQNNKIDNLVSLCPVCHGRTNTNRIFWIKFFTEIIPREVYYDPLET